MIKFKIRLNGVEDISLFSSSALMTGFDIDLAHDRYVIDGKSIMGIFSLDLSKDIECILHCDKEEAKDFMRNIDRCIIK